MAANLRLDMYVNGHEYLICEAPANEDGFEQCLNASDAVTSTIAGDIRTTGGTMMDKDEQMTDAMLDILWDITGAEITERDEITFCMCEWNGGEHIRSLVTESEMSK
jgi:hypothetical protein